MGRIEPLPLAWSCDRYRRIPDQAQHLRGWDETQHAIGEATKKARKTRDLLMRHRIECPTITGAGTSTFDFEAASGVYTELQCGSYIFMDADYGRNLDRDGVLVGSPERLPIRGQFIGVDVEIATAPEKPAGGRCLEISEALFW